MKSIKFYIALIVGKLVAIAVNIISKDRGTNLSGKYAYKICNDFIKHFKNQIDVFKRLFLSYSFIVVLILALTLLPASTI